ncbi:serine protease inhibitor 2-like [Wyeomyia smithii]|uniref:serine protease inhibitor 2-like n=1 Tax=Wyeomyia smithii TaxID=174621 RepID=UPI002467F4D4|nr:serine protease inhibitor 2-like [Wyeomyia smithii]
MINQWVSDNTQGRIQELVSADGVDGAVITLINAIYFKGLWTYPFPENGPQRKFYGSQKQIDTLYMEQSGQFYYENSSTLNAQLLRLPFRGGKFAMYFMLPHQGGSINDLLSRINSNATTLHQALRYMDETEMNVIIPKFKFGFSEELSQPLKDIGIREVFLQRASLPLFARSTSNTVRVSRVFQKVEIIINELGSEAYTTTKMQLETESDGDETHNFNANRPFLFFMENEQNGTLLFAGKVEIPTLRKAQNWENPNRRNRSRLRAAFSFHRIPTAVRLSRRPKKMNVPVVIFCCILSATPMFVTERFTGKRHVDFDWRLTKRFFEDLKSNAVISPFSVKILLTLLYEATGEVTGVFDTATARELRKIHNPSGDLKVIRTLYRSLLNSALGDNPDFDFKIATKIFVDEFINVVNKYQVTSDHFYNVTADKVPFSNPKKAADIINQWVSDNTRGRIQELVSADGVDGAVITLINAIYFKGLWTYPFPENGPRREFYGSTKQIDTAYMEQNGQFYYDDSSTLNAQLLRLPYQGEKFAMYFILPHQDSSINDVLSRINSTSLHQAIWYMDETEVNVTIPKFKFEFSGELSQPLQDIGIREIFSQRASLPLLARGRGTMDQIRVSRVFQKAGIVVNELGSKAYAETEMHLVNEFGDNRTQIFNANRPFLFFIEDEDFGTLLFAGKVELPTL